MKEKHMSGATTQALPDLGSRWSELALANMGLTIPKMTQYRLDPPCTFEHGSIGGWLKDGREEIVFTLLWRELRYWRRTQEQKYDNASANEDDSRRLHEEYVEGALRKMKRDSRGLSITSNEEVDIAGLKAHPRNVVDLTFYVRRRLRSLQLTRRQLLWTCMGSGRHMAFEISVLSGNMEVLNQYWPTMSSTIWCGHGE